ncbi:MAG: SHOCT domain-containing protein [Phycisphaerales bacterium]|nr:SHOCT domain-containing protein [Phycisphaerales bacterium]
MMLILAQSLTPEGRSTLFLWLAVLMVAVIVIGVVVMLLRRKLLNNGSTSEGDAGFSLASLRELRDKGEITREEYERAHAKIVGKAREMLRPPEEEE